jgi:hypothetical protein
MTTRSKCSAVGITLYKEVVPRLGRSGYATPDPTKGTVLCWAFFALPRWPFSGRLSHRRHVTILRSEPPLLTTILRGCELARFLKEVPNAGPVLRVVALRTGIVRRATFGRR